MSETHWLPMEAKDYPSAQSQYVEQFGSLIVMNTYLKVALLGVSVVSVGLTAVLYKSYDWFSNPKPLVIRINDVGRAEAVRYDTLEYRPQEAELKYFLADFTQRHYSRMRSNFRDSYARSLYFVDGHLADTIIETNKKTKAVETFLAGEGLECDTEVKSVSIEDLRTAPYRATVDFEKVFYGQDRAEVKREKFVAHIVFVIKDRVPNAMIPVNPLGLTITYFRDDQAFQ